MAAFTYDIYADNRSATYPSWPLIYMQLTANMGVPDSNADVSPADTVFKIYRYNSPNFGRAIYIKQIVLTPAPTVPAPVRVYIDPFNRQMFVDPTNAHAQAGTILQYIHPASRFFDLLPGMTNQLIVNNFPSATGVTFGVRWRKAYA